MLVGTATILRFPGHSADASFAVLVWVLSFGFVAVVWLVMWSKTGQTFTPACGTHNEYLHMLEKRKKADFLNAILEIVWTKIRLNICQAPLCARNGSEPYHLISLVHSARGQRPAQAAALYDLSRHPAQTYIEDGLYALFCVWRGRDPCTYISFGGLEGQCPSS